MQLDIPVKIQHRHNGVSKGCLIIRKIADERRIYHHAIHLNLSAMNDHADAVDTLKHELCHWYCYVTGRDFRDGDADFEGTLRQFGVCSSEFGDASLERSIFYQDMITGGVLKGNRIEGVKYTKVEDERYDSAYDVVWHGEIIGRIGKEDGSWCLEKDIICPVNGSLNDYFYHNRTSLVLEMIYAREKSISC